MVSMLKMQPCIKEDLQKKDDPTNFFYLEPWMEIVGDVLEIVTNKEHLIIRIDNRLLSFYEDSKEAQHIQEKLGTFIGKTVALIKTDIPNKPILMLLVANPNARAHKTGLSYRSENREVVSFRANKELYSDFKPLAKALYGSTCRAFESFMASIVVIDHQKVNFSHTTLANPISIENIVIERNLRPRRKLEVLEEETTEEVKTVKTKRKLISREAPDYSGYSLEKLDRLHAMYKNQGSVGKSALVVAELKRRGVFEK